MAPEVVIVFLALNILERTVITIRKVGLNKTKKHYKIFYFIVDKKLHAVKVPKLKFIQYKIKIIRIINGNHGLLLKSQSQKW